MDGKEEAEQHWLRAQGLLLSGQAEGAIDHLQEAERSFRDSKDDKMVVQVLIAKSRAYLLLGEAAKAKECIDQAAEIAMRTDMLNDERYLIQQGLVNLHIGEEETAGRYLIKYLEISEAKDDLMAQARGHFFLGILHERLDEPCMAAAEMELGRDLALRLDRSLVYARFTAFLSHLWLDEDEVEKAEDLFEEAAQKEGKIPGQEMTYDIGFIMLADAEIRAIRSDWDGSAKAFEQSIQAFRSSDLKFFFEALASAWYGNILMRQGRRKEGTNVIVHASSMFDRLSNRRQADKMKRILVEMPLSSDRSFSF